MMFNNFFNLLKEDNISIWYDNEKLKAFIPKNKQINNNQKQFITENKSLILKTLFGQIKR